MKTTFIIILTFISLSFSAQKIISQKIYSPKMKKDIETIIITPEIKKGNFTKLFIFFTVTVETRTGLTNKTFRIW